MKKCSARGTASRRSPAIWACITARSTTSAEGRGGAETQRSDHLYLLLRRCRQGLPPGPQEEHGKASENRAKDHRLARWLVKPSPRGIPLSAACSMLGKTPETTFSCTLCRQTVYKYIENGDLWPLTNKELRYKSDQKRTYNRVKAAKAPRGDSIEHRRSTSTTGRSRATGRWTA